MSTHPSLSIYLLSIRGILAPATLEAARTLHNETAGAPQNVAVARSLGDLSHMVYAPVQHAGHGAGEILFLDQWNSLEGLNAFFANPHVQAQAGQIFSERDPVVWAPAQGFASYHCPAPYGQNERTVGIVRGTVHTRADALASHNAIVGGMMNKARARGNLSHEAYFQLSPPGAPESLEFFAVDVWYNAAGMGEHYQDPEAMSGIMGMFASEPSATVWTHPTGQWVEW